MEQFPGALARIERRAIPVARRASRCRMRRTARSLFQTLVGAWPMQPTLDDCRPESVRRANYRLATEIAQGSKVAQRMDDAKRALRTRGRRILSWLFAASPLLPEIAAFARRIAPAGAVNSLGQTLFKLTAPGVPDIYQGTEYWDLSLVDPDNRQPVDFAARQQSLTASAGV